MKAKGLAEMSEIQGQTAPQPPGEGPRPMTAIIVDDEVPARQGIRIRLQDEVGIDLIGECGDAGMAVEMIRTLRPDLVFLDIHLSGDIDGLEVLRRASSDHLPKVIFVTAYREHAVEAFAANAVDYLLKPYDRERFKEAISKVRAAHLRGQDEAVRHEQLLQLLFANRQHNPSAWSGTMYADRLVVKEKNRSLIIRAEAVDWIASASNYAEIRSGGRHFMLRATLNELEQRLNPRQFVRIHRATLVNIDRVVEIDSSDEGEHVVLRDGTRLQLSRRNRDRLSSLLFP
jgi:two-component system, LytTR family, response regulator